MGVRFEFDKAQMFQAAIIARRFRSLQVEKGFEPDATMDIMMDLEATHSNGCPLDLGRFVEANDHNLIHDVAGIRRHLNRETGRLENHFLPRFHARAGGES